MRKAVANISTDANSAISVRSCAVYRVKHGIMIWRYLGNVLTLRGLYIWEGKKHVKIGLHFTYVLRAY